MSVEMLHIDIEKRFGAFELAVKAALPLAGVTAVFGPSGSGKSSLLRLIAGFERPASGHISLENHVWAGGPAQVFLPSHKRGVAYVFQDGRLLPHLSVKGNLLYADKRADASRHAYSVQDVVSAFDLEALMARKPATLSGGERQRVALAQALLTRPRLLLLDEPLSALDERRKQDILPYLGRLQNQFSIPMLYVSHDIGEVTRIADNVLMLEAGRKTGFGETVQTLNAHGFQSGEAGRSGVILTGQVTSIDDRLQLMNIAIAEHMLRLPYDEAHPVGSLVRVILRASEIALSVKAPEGLSIQNSLRGHIKTIQAQPENPMATVMLSLGAEMDMPVQVTRSAIESLELAEGSPVYALVKTASLAR